MERGDKIQAKMRRQTPMWVQRGMRGDEGHPPPDVQTPRPNKTTGHRPPLSHHHKYHQSTTPTPLCIGSPLHRRMPNPLQSNHYDKASIIYLSPTTHWTMKQPFNKAYFIKV